MANVTNLIQKEERDRRSKTLDALFESIRSRVLDAREFALHAEAGLDEEVVEEGFAGAWIAAKPNGTYTFCIEVNGGAVSHLLGENEKRAYLVQRAEREALTLAGEPRLLIIESEPLKETNGE